MNRWFNENIRLLIHHFPLLYKLCLMFVRDYGKFYYNRLDKEKKYSSKLKDLKNSKLGERCFIIGNGPSLKTDDLEKIGNEDSFGANRLYKIFDKTNWRPSYYTVIDWRGLENDEVNSLDVKTLFLGDYFYRKHKITRDGCFVFYGNRLLDTRLETFKFSDDISEQIYLGATVTYVNLQIAMYMGYKDIYLIGMDHNYAYVRDKNGGVIRNPNVSETHFFKDKDSSKDYADMEGMTNAYIKAREYAEKRKINIYNATRGGALEIFDRVDFDSLF